MRLALVSDIHGNLPALQAVAAAIDEAGVDQVLNLGDIVSGPLWPQETAQWLMARGWPTLAGNHERQLLAGPAERLGASDAFAAAALGPAERAWLAALPTALSMAGGTVQACHGTPASDLHYLLETVTPDLDHHGSPGLRGANPAELAERLVGVRAELLLCGHSHVQRALLCGPTLVLNPGSVGLQAFDDAHGHPHRVEMGSPHARWALATRTPQGWQLALQATAYDHEAAARQAERHGRGDWADALRSGRVGRTEAEALGRTV